MFLSVNTIRTHVRNILRKLAASRRNEAIRRASDLGIIPRLGDDGALQRLSNPGGPCPSFETIELSTPCRG
jgi:Bacterial regulatory proteins, luxR family